VAKVIIILGRPGPARQSLAQLATNLDGTEIIALTQPGEILAGAAARSPDLVIADLTRPELDCRALFQQLRDGAATAEVPIIAVTAEADTDRRRTAAQAGATAVLRQPVEDWTFQALALLRAGVPRMTQRPAPERAPGRHTFGETVPLSVLVSTLVNGCILLANRGFLDRVGARAETVTAHTSSWTRPIGGPWSRRSKPPARYAAWNWRSAVSTEPRCGPSFRPGCLTTTVNRSGSPWSRISPGARQRKRPWSKTRGLYNTSPRPTAG
jgi:CheY-like chemotaxis protein